MCEELPLLFAEDDELPLLCAEDDELPLLGVEELPVLELELLLL